MRPSLPHRVVSFAVAAIVASAAAGVASADVTVPQGFTAKVVQEGTGAGRHLVVTPAGDIYLASRNGLVALRDANKDGTFEDVKKFGDVQGTEVRLYKDWLYASDNVGVYRYALKKGELVPTGARETVVAGFPMERQHADKTFALDPKGTLYINVGAPSNSCQQKDREEGSLGQNPCPILEKYGGVWVFDGTKTNQTPANGRRFATGMRNAVALEWNTKENALFSVIHGRDSIDTLFPALYTAEDNATRQAEEFHKITDGGDYGWPYTFFDTKLGKRVVAPEYGGDGKKLAEAGKYPDPLVAYPAHWAPNDLLFYSGKNFPAKYQDGAFIAFHGSWNRAPEPQAGYKVVFQPMKNGKPSGAYEVFADGFAGDMKDNNPRNAEYRPVGLAIAPDGSLYVADSQKGRIWHITYGK
ncbi:MAG TPA: PQQ-dependent sugar dehydrogenase [Steroidobacteraceae bacterium]|nr:PQQ-dependent sugar dehydrogenase [Steroidobacteraceae bacterium]